MRLQAGDCMGFGQSQPQGQLGCGFTRQGGFIDIWRGNIKRQVQTLE